MGTATIRIVGRTGEAWQTDSAIVRVDPGWYVQGALPVRQVGELLRKVSERCAADLGEILHHADWTITGDSGEVCRLSLTGDHAACAECVSGTSAAVEWLAANPGGEVAVGQMWWWVHP